MGALVVVPTYNEAPNIETVIRRIRAALPDAGVIVVDDDSPDGTADLVAKLGLELGGIEVIRRPGKGGLGSAYRDGFAAALAGGAAVVVQMDADLSHDPAMLPALVSAVEHGASLAMGSRYVPGGRIVGWPWRRRSLSRWGNRYAAGMLGLAVNDATSGFRAYDSAALGALDLPTIRADGYGFQIEMTHRLVRGGGSVVEIPIVFVDRTHGESKLSGGIVREALVLVARLAFRDLFNLRRWRRPS
ncbi:MAG: polyprenol monophosphomannose synthase [Acidimicrobiia bacterium]